MKRFFKFKCVFFPSTTDLLDAREKLRPVLDDKGVEVIYKELICTKTSAILDICNDRTMIRPG